MSFDKYIADYIEHMTAKGYKMFDFRKTVLQNFMIYLGALQIYDPKDVTTELIDQYFHYLKTEYVTYMKKPLSNSGFSHYVSTLYDFFKWLEDNGEILISPIMNRPVVPRDGKIPEAFTEEEVLKILEACKFSTPIGLRNRAMLELLYSTGIRIGELINLNLEDFLLERQELVIINGKGQKDRVVPVGEIACKILEIYLKMVRPWQVCSPEERALFISTKTGKRLNMKTLRSAISYVCKKAGITRAVRPHMFRHTMASHLLRNGADIRHIQQILGHKNIATTEIYTHMNIEDLKKVVKEKHPHGKRAKKA
jgi:integrase/recombinase XerD